MARDSQSGRYTTNVTPITDRLSDAESSSEEESIEVVNHAKTKTRNGKQAAPQGSRSRSRPKNQNGFMTEVEEEKSQRSAIAHKKPRSRQPAPAVTTAVKEPVR